MLMWGVVVILGVVIGFAGYVRLAPHNVERWHRAANYEGVEPKASLDAYLWRAAVADDGTAMLAKLDAAVSTTARTTLLAGSVAEGKVTYVTRSRLMGFPDYNTIGIYEADGQRYIEINSRLRFGQSDLGVNKKRVQGWLAVLEAG